MHIAKKTVCASGASRMVTMKRNVVVTARARQGSNGSNPNTAPVSQWLECAPVHMLLGHDSPMERCLRKQATSRMAQASMCSHLLSTKLFVGISSNPICVKIFRNWVRTCGTTCQGWPRCSEAPRHAQRPGQQLHSIKCNHLE